LIYILHIIKIYHQYIYICNKYMCTFFIELVDKHLPALHNVKHCILDILRKFYKWSTNKYLFGPVLNTIGLYTMLGDVYYILVLQCLVQSWACGIHSASIFELYVIILSENNFYNQIRLISKYVLSSQEAFMDIGQRFVSFLWGNWYS
jgi:hypothetical protein